MSEAKHPRRTFKNIEAAADISFSVQPGEIFGLLGSNSTGKTITLRTFSDQINPSGAALDSATVAGCDVVKERSG